MMSTRKSPANQAVGSYEAAGLLGVHHTVVGKMATRGWISAQILHPAHVASPTKSWAIYDGGECDRNYLDYEDSRGNGGRPRSWVHLRPVVLQHLAGVEHPIAYADAIGPAEAAEILRVHPSFLTRMVKAGKILARRPWSPNRAGLAANYIYSRQSCLDNVQEARRMQSKGVKVGRPRNLS